MSTALPSIVIEFPCSPLQFVQANVELIHLDRLKLPPSNSQAADISLNPFLSALYKPSKYNNTFIRDCKVKLFHGSKNNVTKDSFFFNFTLRIE